MAPLFFASAVLPDGRLIVEGGEQNFANYVWTNMGAIYDPLTNVWTSINPPAGWGNYRRRVGRCSYQRDVHAGQLLHRPAGVTECVHLDMDFHRLQQVRRER